MEIEKELDKWFSHQSVANASMRRKCEAIENYGYELAECIRQHVKSSFDQQMAIYKVREAILLAVNSIICD